MSRPTSPDRDSSLRIGYGPEDSLFLSRSTDRVSEYRDICSTAPVGQHCSPKLIKLGWRTAVQLVGNALNTARDFRKRHCNTFFGASGGGNYRVPIAAKRLQLGFQPGNTSRQLRDLVHDHDSGHDGDPEIADFAELPLEMADITVETNREVSQMIFLPSSQAMR